MAARRLTRRQIERIHKAQERRRERAARQASSHVMSLADSGLYPEQPGLVIANYGPSLIIEDPHGGLHRCVARQNLGLLACGDRVVWQDAAAGDGVIVALQERRSLLSRPDYGGRLKPVAANLDQVAVVIALRPEPNAFLIDRYLVAIAAIGADALLVVNKLDLLGPEARAAIEQQLATYCRIGYPILFVSARSPRSLEALCERLRGRASILVGQSGVGKSSLIQTLLPDRSIRIQALSETTGLGTHATTTATLYHLPGGGDLIDSPGVRSFELGEVQHADLERGFVEFAPYLGQCRFSDCSHGAEPGCALREAAERGEIDPRRLQSYRQLRDALQTT